MSLVTLERTSTGDPRRLLLRCSPRLSEYAKRAGRGTATWRKKEELWSYPADPTVLRSLVETLKPRLDAGVRDWAERLSEQQQRVLTAADDYSPLATDDPLWPFQRASVRFLAEARRAILGHEMGVGKTVIAVAACNWLNLQRVVVVCPSTLKWSWADHFWEWAGRQCHILEAGHVPKADRSQPGATIIYGGREKREEQLSELVTKESFVLVINYDSAKIHHELLSAPIYDAVIFDEAHRMKNRKTGNAKMMLKIANRAPYCWALTGTPIRNKREDIYTLLRLCDHDRFGAYWSFVDLYFESVPGRYGGRDIVGLRDQNAWNKMLSTYMFRKTKTEVMSHLPKKIYKDVPLPMTATQRQVYRRMEDEFLMEVRRQLEDGTEIETILRAPTVLAQLTRLRQICLSPAVVGGKGKSAKLEALEDMLTDWEDKQVIIYSYYRAFLPFITSLLRDRGIAYGEIVGGQPSAERRKVERALNTGEIQVIVGTAQSMGEGLNLQKATVAVFCDIDWVPANNKQAEDRIHRGEITEHPTIVRLYHPGTVEEAIRETNRRKQDIEDETVGAVEVVRQMLLKGGKS